MMAPEQHDAASAVEIMSISDADVENMVSNSTSGTVPATGMLKPTDDSVGEWGSPSPPHLDPSTARGATPLPIFPSFTTAFRPGRDRR